MWTLAALSAIALVGFGVVWWLVRLHAAESPARAWWDAWSFDPAQLAERRDAWLFLASALGLFLELLMIRWISSEIRIFAYFKNFVLIACFLGFGLGCHMSRRRANVLAALVPLALLVLFVEGPRELVDALPNLLGAGSEVHVWGVPTLPVEGVTLAALAVGVAVSVPVFALVAFVFVPIGQVVGHYLENGPDGIRAYTINVTGSLVGIAAFTA